MSVISSQLSSIVEAAIAKRIFPGAVVYLARGDDVIAHAAFGTTAYDAEYSGPVTTETLYDLASLTKLFTSTAFLIASRESKLDASTPAWKFFPEFQEGDKRAMELRDLLRHNSGIEIAIQSLIDISPAEWISHIAAAPLCSAPRERVLYSCTNFFLLARAIEILSGQALDEFIAKEILQPLQMERSSFYPREQVGSDEIAPTEIVDGKLIHGIVHDEAARAWQEYAGHASCGNSGLFGTASDLANFCTMWSNDGNYNGRRILTPHEIFASTICPIREPNTIAKRGWGWQVDASFYMGAHAPGGSIGHAGFTGPTLWMNRRTRDVCIILNNRVHPTRNGPERFPVHRKIARLLLAEKPRA